MKHLFLIAAMVAVFFLAPSDSEAQDIVIRRDGFNAIINLDDGAVFFEPVEQRRRNGCASDRFRAPIVAGDRNRSQVRSAIRNRVREFRNQRRRFFFFIR